jgi:3-(3-hydroxy-phenyl)propionate hydroxylase
MPQPPGEKYLPMYNLQQQYIEKFLHDAVAGCDLVDMRWQSEVAGIECRNDGVSLSVASPAGDYRLEADYVLAADGARSPVRSQLGLRLKGENYEGKYVIADIRMDHDFPTERRAFFEPSGNPGGTVLIHKQPDDIWRVDYQLREGESEEEALREENIRARVGAILRDIGHDKPWSWNGGASIPPTRCASMTTGTAGCSSSATPRISCRSSACAVSTTASPTRTISAGSSQLC